MMAYSAYKALKSKREEKKAVKAEEAAQQTLTSDFLGQTGQSDDNGVEKDANGHSQRQGHQAQGCLKGGT